MGEIKQMSVKTDLAGNILSGPGCSKLTMSLVNVSLNFQKLISKICQYVLLKNVKSFNKIQWFWL